MSSSKKTGILTLSAAQNYGAVLQAYALCQFINDHFSECEIIDFIPKFMEGRYPVFSIDTSSVYKIIRTTIGAVLRLPVKYRKKIKFEKFRNKCCRYSTQKFRYFIGEDLYDQYIIGSDQVFNLELTNNELTYFLPFVHDSCKKATYAASLGVSALTVEQEKVFSENLKSFKYISIREENGCALIRELLPNKKVEKKIDPVFLIPRAKWETLLCKRKYKTKYVLIYTFKNFELAYNIAKGVAQDDKIIYICDERRKVKSDVCNAKAVGPEDFLSLIKYSEYVITDSFHGAAFSVVFNKNFSAIPYTGTEQRLLNMLDTFGLRERVVTSNQKIRILPSIDYKNINLLIDEQRNDAYRYLKQIYAD